MPINDRWLALFFGVGVFVRENGVKCGSIVRALYVLVQEVGYWLVAVLVAFPAFGFVHFFVIHLRLNILNE